MRDRVYGPPFAQEANLAGYRRNQAPTAKLRRDQSAHLHPGSHAGSLNRVDLDKLLIRFPFPHTLIHSPSSYDGVTLRHGQIFRPALWARWNIVNLKFL